jgi:hypothetical protein
MSKRGQDCWLARRLSLESLVLEALHLEPSEEAEPACRHKSVQTQVNLDDCHL